MNAGSEQCQNRKSAIRLLADGFDGFDFDRAIARSTRKPEVFEVNSSHSATNTGRDYRGVTKKRKENGLWQIRKLS